MKDSIIKGLGLGVILGLMFLTAILLVRDAKRVQGSVAVSNEYIATTTDSGWSTATSQCKDTLTTFKTLGSVNVTLTSNARLEIYDATSTIHTDYATSTVAIFPSTTAGSYPFDVQLKRGLCVVVNTAVGVASTTITVR